LRILKVVQAYYPFQEQGGPVVKVRALARGLVERGHDVSVLTADLGLAGRTNNASKFNRCKWGWCSEQDGVKAVYLSTIASCRSLTFNPGVVGFSRALDQRFDVVHVYGLYDLIGPIVGTFCRNLGIPYIVEPMGMFRPIVRSIPLKRLYHRGPGKRLIAGARYLVATSDLERRELI